VVRADIQQRGTGRQLVGHQLSRGPGEQNLATSTQRQQPSRPIERLPIEVAVAQLGLTGVQRSPCRQGNTAREVLGGQRSLQRDGGGRGLACPHKHRQGRVTLPPRLDELPAMGGDRLSDERLMAGQCGPHDRPVPLPQQRGPFDVGQQEGQNAFRELGRHAAPARLAVGVVGPVTHKANS
jgi:hypothetical protein